MLRQLDVGREKKAEYWCSCEWNRGTASSPSAWDNSAKATGLVRSEELQQVPRCSDCTDSPVDSRPLLDGPGRLQRDNSGHTLDGSDLSALPSFLPGTLGGLLLIQFPHPSLSSEPPKHSH